MKRLNTKAVVVSSAIAVTLIGAYLLQPCSLLFDATRYEREATSIGTPRPSAQETDLPEIQTSFDASGVVYSLKSLRAIKDKTMSALIDISNLTEEPVGIATTQYRGSTQPLSQSVVSNERGDTCIAGPNPVGLVTYPYRPVSRASADELTSIPPHTRIQTVMIFQCPDVGESFSVVSEFVQRQDGKSAGVTIPFWGIKINRAD